MAEKHPFSQQEFDAIFSKVPRLTVEVIIKNADGAIYLTQRSIEPCKGQWYLPGGTVRFGEPLTDAVKRIARRELDVEATALKQVGYIEYPSHYLHGLDSPVGIAFEVTHFNGTPAPEDEASAGGWFTQAPEKLHADLDEFLLERGYLQS